MSRQETVSEKLIDLSLDEEESTSSVSTSRPPVVFSNPSLEIETPDLPREPIGFKFILEAGWIKDVNPEFDKYSSYHTVCKLSLDNGDIDEAIATCDTAISEATAALEKEPSPQLIAILLYFHYVNEKIYEGIQKYAEAKSHCVKVISLLNTPSGKILDSIWHEASEKFCKCFEIIYISILNSEGNFEEASARLDLINHDIRYQLQEILSQNIANQSSTGDTHKKIKDRKLSPKVESKQETVKSIALPVTLFYEFDEEKSNFGVGAKWIDALPEKWEKFRAATKKSFLAMPKQEAIDLLNGYIKQLSNESNLENVSVLIIMHRTLGLIYKNHKLLNESWKHYLIAQDLIKEHSLPKEWEIGNSLNLYTLNLAFNETTNNDEAVKVLKFLFAKVDFKPFERDILIRKLPAELQKQFTETSDSTKLVKSVKTVKFKVEDSDSSPEVAPKVQDSDSSPEDEKSEDESSLVEAALQRISRELSELAEAANKPEVKIYHQVKDLMLRSEFTVVIKKCEGAIDQLKKNSSHLDSNLKSFFLFMFTEMKAVALFNLADVQIKNGSIELADQYATPSIESMRAAEKYLNSLHGSMYEPLHHRFKQEMEAVTSMVSFLKKTKKNPIGMELFNALLLACKASNPSESPFNLASAAINHNSIWQQPTTSDEEEEDDEDKQLQRAIELSKKDTHGRGRTL